MQNIRFVFDFRDDADFRAYMIIKDYVFTAYCKKKFDYEFYYNFCIGGAHFVNHPKIMRLFDTIKLFKIPNKTKIITGLVCTLKKCLEQYCYEIENSDYDDACKELAKMKNILDAEKDGNNYRFVRINHFNEKYDFISELELNGEVHYLLKNKCGGIEMMPANTGKVVLTF